MCVCVYGCVWVLFSDIQLISVDSWLLTTLGRGIPHCSVSGMVYITSLSHNKQILLSTCILHVLDFQKYDLRSFPSFVSSQPSLVSAAVYRFTCIISLITLVCIVHSFYVSLPVFLFVVCEFSWGLRFPVFGFLCYFLNLVLVGLCINPFFHLDYFHILCLKNLEKQTSSMQKAWVSLLYLYIFFVF